MTRLLCPEATHIRYTKTVGLLGDSPEPFDFAQRAKLLLPANCCLSLVFPNILVSSHRNYQKWEYCLSLRLGWR